jgi:peptidylamidoglycolate lyase
MPSSRRSFIKRGAVIASALPAFNLTAKETPILGGGDFRYRVVPDWGVLGEDTPVKNGHGIVTDREGHIILFTDQVKNNVIVYDRTGKLVHKWGTNFPGAHGLSIVDEGDRQVLFLTDLSRNLVCKTGLDGEILEEWTWPEASGKYTQASQYKPSWTLHHPEGGFYVLDGYGKDYIHHYDTDGKHVATLGGPEGGIVHWGPHGGMMENRPGKKPRLLIAMSDQQYLLPMELDGTLGDTIPLPGGNPRQIRKHGEYFFLAHLADNWPKNRNSRGYVSILDASYRVLANVGGSAPEYTDEGMLQPMHNTSDVFLHPHDLTVDQEGSIYVAQFASGNTYPIKLERV